MRHPVRSLSAVAALAVATLGACTTGGGGGTTPTETASTPVVSPSATEETTVALVYYVVDSRAGIRLVREPHELDFADPVKAAVEAMIAGPVDPDYATTWNPDTVVNSVTREGDVITVDLSAEARTANVGSEGAERMVQQLVWTASEVTSELDKVLLTIDGETAGELWGVLVWDAPIGRAAPEDVMQLVQIDYPGEGEAVASPVTVSGGAAAFEANVPWRVLDADGAEVQAGFTMAQEGQRFTPYSFQVELEPGTYTIVVEEDDPSGGAGGTPMSDSRTVTVE